jgi:hypothetical protein
MGFGGISLEEFFRIPFGGALGEGGDAGCRDLLAIGSFCAC